MLFLVIISVVEESRQPPGCEEQEHNYHSERAAVCRAEDGQSVVA